jgi:hypothetical protein
VLNFFLAFVVLMTTVNEAHSRKASIPLESLTNSADVIAVAKVDKVTKISGAKVAEATVIRPLKGLKEKQQFTFLAEGTWTCDTSHAVEGETVFIFLRQPNLGEDFLKKHPKFKSEQAQRFPNVPFYEISHSGSGRMSTYRKDDIDWFVAMQSPFTANAPLMMDSIYFPSDLHTYPHPNPERTGLRLVLLKDVEKRVAQCLKEANPSPKVKRNPSR